MKIKIKIIRAKSPLFYFAIQVPYSLEQTELVLFLILT